MNDHNKTNEKQRTVSLFEQSVMMMTMMMRMMRIKSTKKNVDLMWLNYDFNEIVLNEPRMCEWQQNNYRLTTTKFEKNKRKKE